MRLTEATRVLFVRHAHTTALGAWLCGRQSGVALSALGRRQAVALARTLRSIPLAAIYSSPLERAHATARAIAQHQSCSVRRIDDLNELDFGTWTGSTFAELDRDPTWHAFNRARATSVVPRGEQPAVAQDRIVAVAARLADQHRGDTIALVTHAEIIRMALLHYQSRSLDLYHSLSVDPASVTTVMLSAVEARILDVNVRYDARTSRNHPADA